MSNRLDQDREKKLEPKRMEYALDQLKRLNVTLTYIGEKRIDFLYKGNEIKLYPYSGWHSGKGIKDGRGIHNLIKQIEPC